MEGGESSASTAASISGEQKSAVSSSSSSSINNSGKSSRNASEEASNTNSRHAAPRLENGAAGENGADDDPMEEVEDAAVSRSSRTSPLPSDCVFAGAGEDGFKSTKEAPLSQEKDGRKNNNGVAAEGGAALCFEQCDAANDLKAAPPCSDPVAVATPATAQNDPASAGCAGSAVVVDGLAEKIELVCQICD